MPKVIPRANSFYFSPTQHADTCLSLITLARFPKFRCYQSNSSQQQRNLAFHASFPLPEEFVAGLYTHTILFWETFFSSPTNSFASYRRFVQLRVSFFSGTAARKCEITEADPRISVDSMRDTFRTNLRYLLRVLPWFLRFENRHDHDTFWPSCSNMYERSEGRGKNDMRDY